MSDEWIMKKASDEAREASAEAVVAIGLELELIDGSPEATSHGLANGAVLLLFDDVSDEVSDGGFRMGHLERIGHGLEGLGGFHERSHLFTSIE